MIYEQFLKIIGYPATKKASLFCWYNSRSKINKTELMPNAIEIEWEIGGSSGGNCYGGESHSYSVSATPPNFDELDQIVEKVDSKISFLAYKRLIPKIPAEEGEYVDCGDFYGNCVRHAYKSIKLLDIYETMIKEGIINA